MKKKFNSSQVLKSSEDCYKFSKSVSYETLVIGATTIGREIKQIWWLSKCCRIKPLTAVGTFSAFNNAEKVVEKWLKMSPVLRLVKIISLVAVLSISMVSESQAACNYTNDDGDAVDEAGNYCGTCGTDCHWALDDKGNMKITGSGKMDDYYDDKDSRPWLKHKKDIYSVSVTGVTFIGGGAFSDCSNIQSVDIGDDVSRIGRDAFWGNNLTSVFIPDSVTRIDNWAFFNNPILSANIPDSLSSFGERVFGENIIANNFQVTCRGGRVSCLNLKNIFSQYKHYNKDGEYIQTSVNVNLANFEQCASTNHFWNGAECVREPDISKRKCCDSCKDMGGYCNRIRYTPAEAAEVLHDDNTNEVTITFKK